MNGSRIDRSFCPYSQDTDGGGHSPEWSEGDRCRWCGLERHEAPPDIIVTQDVGQEPWTRFRGGNFREGDIRQVGLYRHDRRGRMVAIRARLTDGSDAIVYASLSSMIAAWALVRRSALYLDETRRPHTTVDIHWTTLVLALIVVALVVALGVALT